VVRGLSLARNSRKSIAAHAPTIGARQVNWAYHRRVAFPSELGNSTSRQLQSTSPALVVPVGSTEQHGPHLPLDTDTRIATAVARAVADRLEDRDECRWVLAPAIAYGASGEHEGFPGTVSIGTSALRLLLVEFGRSASRWASRLVFVNGHGGNVEALAAATALLRYEGRDVSWCSCTVEDADPHAGHTETSVLLHISPKDVWTDERLPGNSAPLSDLMPQLRRGGVAAVSELGVLGDPTTATADEGERILASIVDGCLQRIAKWVPDRDGMLT
jgi:mycofactocin precursor peptide peptidase